MTSTSNNRPHLPASDHPVALPHHPATVRANELRLLGVLLAVCTLFIAAAAAVGIATGVERPLSPLALGDVSEAHIVEFRDRHGVGVVSGEFRSRVDAIGNTEKDAALVDRRGRRVIGEVELEIPAPGRAERRAELEVDVIGLPPREVFLVAIDDRIVGSFTTDDRGSFDMELQEGEVPPRSTP